MKDIVIIGCGGFALEVAFLIERVNYAQNGEWNLLGYIDDETQRGALFNNREVVGNDTWLLTYPKELAIVCAIANPSKKERVIRSISCNKNLYFPNLIDPSVIMGKSVVMGRGNIVCAGNIFTEQIEVGDFNTINLNCTVGHNTKVKSYITLYPGVNVSGNVSISSYVEIGTGSCIIQGIRIGEKSIIGAGTVVIRDVDVDCTVVGNPAHMINKRS